jgi:probable DNA repair protein
MSTPIEFEALLDAAADAATTLVTPNRRLAAWIERAFDAAQVKAGKRAWPRPDIVPFMAFVEREWRALVSKGGNAPSRVLSEHATLALWERAIRDSMAEGAPMMNPAKAAREAREAWRLTQAWQLGPAFAAGGLPADAEMFRLWSERFAALCGDLRAVTTAQLPDALSRALGDAPTLTMRPMQRIVAFEFDLTTPQQEKLWRAWEGAGVHVAAHHWAQSPSTQISRHAFVEENEELGACAQWVRTQLMANADASIAIVAPDVARIKGPLLRALAETLTPARRFAAETAGVCDPAIVNTSLGTPLGDFSLVRDALQLIAAVFVPHEKVAASRWSALLRSPWVRGATSEAGARAALDAESLGSLPLELSFSDCLAAWQRSGVRRHAAACSIWFSSERSAQHAAAGPAKRSAHEWVAAFGAVLQAWGFPGDATLDSSTFQVLAAFRESLAELPRAHVGRTRLGASEALAQLRRIVADTPFQIESQGVSPPIEVLGVLESAGLKFDALWVLGLDEDHWPLTARPHPFLPSGVQRRLPIPETSREASLELDRRLTGAWRSAAPVVVFSHAQRLAGSTDERVLAPSALIGDIPESAFALATEASLTTAIAASAQCESVGEAPPAALPEGTVVRGGASVLRDQAACPFRAFAIHRLGAVGLDAPNAKPDAQARGNVLHRALSLLWTELQSRAGLDRADLATVISDAAETALAEAQRAHPLNFPGRLAALERERLTRVLAAWLEVERGRNDFSVIGNEIAREANVGGLSMRVRLDRVDRLHDGTVALIDYKTGEAKPAAWLGERPDEPQLPLYFASSDEMVSAVAFARVKRGAGFGFAGFSAVESLLPGVKPVEQQPSFKKAGYESWDVLTAHWDATVTRLARAFLRGDADIDPKNGGMACKRCDLHALCRIAERGGISEEPDEDSP